MYRRKTCEKSDITVIRDFLVKTVSHFDEKVNWHIDRLNFTYSVSRVMNGISEAGYREPIVMYYDDEQLKAVILSEGENSGERFIAVDCLDLDDSLIQMIFDDLDREDEIFLRLPVDGQKLRHEAVQRGYVLEPWSEITLKMMLKEPFSVHLPSGFTFGQPSSQTLGKCHAYAFGYYERAYLLDRIVDGLEELKKMPDYDASLDIAVMNDQQEVVSFVILWYDEKNQIGILEPVGTHPDYRGLGLAKTAIYHGCNQLMQRGAKAVYVGSNQEFYKKIGFSYVAEDKVYKKSIK